MYKLFIKDGHDKSHTLINGVYFKVFYRLFLSILPQNQIHFVDKGVCYIGSLAFFLEF